MGELYEWLKSLKGSPVYPGIPCEELSPELTTVTETGAADLLKVYKFDLSSLQADEFIRFFVDGVQRTAIVQELNLLSPPIPVVASHIIAGAFERENNEVRPAIIRELLVLLFPRSALMQKFGDNVPKQMYNVPIPTLDSTGDFYVKASQSQLGVETNIFFVDSSITFEKTPKPSIEPSELIAIGKLRGIALNRISAIRRALEVGIVMELRKKYPKDFICIDGPLARMMFLIYARLADSHFEYLSDLSDSQKSFEFLQKVLGVVKEVEFIPRTGLEHAFNTDAINIPIFQIIDPEKMEQFRHLICCFIWIRPELRKFIPISGTMASGLIRVDVPIPAICDYVPSWLNPNEFRPDLNNSSSSCKKLEGILKAILRERLPLPSTHSHHRLFVELFPIAEGERILKSRLMSHEELRLIVERM